MEMLKKYMTPMLLGAVIGAALSQFDPFGFNKPGSTIAAKFPGWFVQAYKNPLQLALVFAVLFVAGAAIMYAVKGQPVLAAIAAPAGVAAQAPVYDRLMASDQYGSRGRLSALEFKNVIPPVQP